MGCPKLGRPKLRTRARGRPKLRTGARGRPKLRIRAFGSLAFLGRLPKGPGKVFGTVRQLLDSP